MVISRIALLTQKSLAVHQDLNTKYPLHGPVGAGNTKPAEPICSAVRVFACKGYRVLRQRRDLFVGIFQSRRHELVSHFTIFAEPFYADSGTCGESLAQPLRAEYLQANRTLRRLCALVPTLFGKGVRGSEAFTQHIIPNTSNLTRVVHGRAS